ncbi:filamentous hemagglutinin family protein [Desulfobacterota bacterium M19]
MANKSKKKYSRIIIQQIIALSTLILLQPQPGLGRGLPSSYYAAQAVLNRIMPPGANTLPNIRQVISGVAGLDKNAAANRLTVRQNQKKAVLDWNSFDIGTNAEMIFDQQGHTNWAALNRIYDSNPSRIYGKLKADGKVFLLNHNGILFGPGSRINVHSLVASSLNIDQNDFLNNIMHFKVDAGAGGTPGTVSNQGRITTDQTGSVFLIGPSVENSGSIDAPAGQIGLIAGREVKIDPVSENEAQTRIASWVTVVDAPGTAVNQAGGKLESATGLVGMYGRVVNQEGMIRTVVALDRQNKTGIELLASNEVTTGAESVTEAPISASGKTQILKSAFTGGRVTLGGLVLGNAKAAHPAAVWIEHKGRITAPSGTVTLKASKRVLLDSGSSIDVSGSWVGRPMQDAFVDVKLTSEVLRDDYPQKHGSLLGATVRVNAREGTAIGDISGALASRENTALQDSTAGGHITLDPGSGDVVFNPGASIKFSGGGTVYKSGLVATTKLVADNVFYDIGKASPDLVYAGVFGHYEKKHARYNTTDVYSGLAYGNGTMKYFEGFTEGDNAGSLEMDGNALVMSGTLEAHAETGRYQTEWTEKVNRFGSPITRGRRRPRGGVLIMGRSGASTNMDNLDRVVIAAGTGSGQRFAMDDPLPTSTINGISQAATILPADTISFAGLSELAILSDTTLEIDPDAALRLQAGGTFSGTARLVIERGTIDIPGGNVNLYSDENMTSFPELYPDKAIYLPEEGVLFTDTSRINVVGAEVDNRLTDEPGGGQLRHGVIDGGSVTVQDRIDHERGGGEVVIGRGAVVDVSGGYEISPDGGLQAGDAGRINLQGAALVLKGTLLGRSLAGAAGGVASFHSDRVLIGGKVPELPAGQEDGSQPLPVDFFAGYMPDDLKGGPIDSLTPARARGLILDPGLLRNSGFTDIEVKSVGDLVVKSGTVLSPSVMKAVSPLRNITAASGINTGSRQGPAVVPLAEDLLGTSSLRLAAGQEFKGQDSKGQVPRELDNARLIVEKNAVLRATPAAGPRKSSITLQGPLVEIDGKVLAPAGNISIEAKADKRIPVIHVADTAVISAAGDNVPYPSTSTGWQPLSYKIFDAGSIAMKTKLGQVMVDAGALLDVSGSAPAAAGYYQDRAGSENIHAVVGAGAAGRLEIEYGDALKLDGKLRGGVSMAGIKGGEISITRAITNTALTVNADDFSSYLAAGFESLSFASYREIHFGDAVNFSVPRTLSLNAPVISGNGGDINLQANHILLRNTLYGFNGGTANSVPAGSLGLTAAWLDVEGGSYLKGFDTVSLRSLNDLTLDDVYSTPAAGAGGAWHRTLSVDNDLTMRAARIYPRTRADFKIRAGGKITLLPDGEKKNRGPIYSAGGRIAIAGRDIDLRGYLAAPMGRISLAADGGDGRVYLAPGAAVSTRGEADVHYGLLNEENWSAASTTGSPSDPAQNTAVKTAPGKSVVLSGSEVIVSHGADIDVAGGGAVSGDFFLPGIEGSVNPLAGKYVVLPDHSARRPGPAVFLEGAEKLGLTAGVYSLLPADYAFVPGALVVELLRTVALPGQQGKTVRQGVVVAGYKTETGIKSVMPLQTGFWVRSAPDVLREGNFTTRSLAAGDGGSVSLNADSAILNGSIKAGAMPGYKGGSLDLAVRNAIEVGSGSAPLPADFSFASELPAGLSGRFFLDGKSISTAGLAKMTIGTISYDRQHKIIAAATTDSITMLKNSRLNVPELALNAMDISLRPGARLEAVSGDGTMALRAGRVETAAGSEMRAANAFSLEADTLDMNGSLQVDSSSLSLLSPYMYFLPPGVSYDDITAAGGNPHGMYLPYSLQEMMGGLHNITLQGRYGIEFLADTSLNIAGNLTLDGAVLRTGADHRVTLDASTVNLLHSGAEAAAPGGTNQGGGFLGISADRIQIGKGDLLLDGFRQTTLAARGGLIFRGKGSLTANGDLQLSGSKVTTSYYKAGSEPYQPADFTVKAQESLLSVLPGVNQQGAGFAIQEVPGGSLELSGRSVDISGDVEVPAGNLLVTATGEAGDGDGIFLRSGALLAARGNVYENRIQAGGGERVLSRILSGGRVDLQAPQGRISLAGDSRIDVSTLKGDGDAGEIILYAPTGGVGLGGELAAHTAGAGAGGALSLETDRIGDFSAFYAGMKQSGFSRAMELGVRSGNIVIGNTDVVTTPNLTLSTDNGDIVVQGTIDASAAGDGGMVKLYGKNVVVDDGGKVLARGRKGGTVEMGAVAGVDGSDGWIVLKNGALVDVSGGSGAGGKVHMRAGVNDDGTDVKVKLSSGTITGEAETVVEAVQVHQLNTGAGTVTSSKLNGWGTAARTFMSTQQADIGKGKSRLLAELQRAAGASDNFHLRPGIEVRSAPGDNLGVYGTLDLSNSAKWRYDGEPGILTLRSQGNLTVNGSIIDAPAGAPAGDNLSWGVNLAAGADTDSGNVMAVRTGRGDLQIGGGSGSLIFTDSGALRFASGGDTIIGKGVSQKGYFYFNNSGQGGTAEKLDYTIASVSGDISGRVGGDLIFNGGAVQDGTGSVSLDIDGSLKLADSAIRTIGRPMAIPEVLPERLRSLPAWYLKRFQLQEYWDYRDGGDINIKVRKNYESRLNKNAWDADYGRAVRIFDLNTGAFPPNAWGANYGSAELGSPLRGLAAMGGGSVTVRAGGDFTGQTGTFGTGDLSIRAGGDVNGRFLVARGEGNISSMANIGTAADFPTVLELLDARVDVSAQGDLLLGGIVNPTIANEKFSDINYWNLTYSHSQVDPLTGRLIASDTAARLTSVFGDVALSSDYSYYYPNASLINSHTRWAFVHLLPPVLDLQAGRDIRLSGTEPYTMAPSPSGQLSMIAGGSISGQRYDHSGKENPQIALTIGMADMDPAVVYGNHGDEINSRFKSYNILDRMGISGGMMIKRADGTTAVVSLHSGDKEPVTIMAGGDISAIGLNLPKQARIMAGGSIHGFSYTGQNIAPDDISEIIAKGDISLERTVDNNFSMGIRQGGPGFLLVKADNSLNLGTSQGITTVGSLLNQSLEADGSALAVMVGYKNKLSESELRDFFGRLRQAGEKYSRLLAEGGNEAGASVLAATRRDVILPALGTDTGSGTGGNLDMINSRIKTSGGADDIFMVVRGDINVGRTTFSKAGSQKSTGITTERGGSVNVFTGYGDLNVNESRLMTFMGGDLTAWCDYGNINAGRGSTTAISAEGESYTKDADGNLMPVFSPPSVGSGIRTLTFDPDGSAGPLTEPEAGSVYLFAPSGEIDAGEAGIAGTNVILAATKVVNAQNISFSQGGVGVPASGGATGGIGALSGAGDLGGMSRSMTESTSALARAKQQFAGEAAKLAEAFQLKWVSVEFTGFGSSK